MNTEPKTRTHEYSPFSYTRTAPRPDIDAVQNALRMLPDEPVLSLNDTIRVEMYDQPRLLDDETIVYPRSDKRTQAPRKRICYVKVDPRRGNVPRSTAQIVADTHLLLG